MIIKHHKIISLFCFYCPSTPRIEKSLQNSFSKPIFNLAQVFYIKKIALNFHIFPHDSVFSSSLIVFARISSVIWNNQQKFTIIFFSRLQILTQHRHHQTQRFSKDSCNNGYKSSKSYFISNSSDNDTRSSAECSANIDKSCWGKSLRNSFYRRVRVNV